MNNNLLEKGALISLMMAGLTACGGGADEGYDPQFQSEDSITFTTDNLMAEFSEGSGVQSIDLLEGAMAGDAALSTTDSRINISQLTFVAENNFQTPQSESSTVATHTVSPFTLSEDTTKLLVDTDAFADALHMCDSRDNRGAEDAEGNPTGDGNLDFPAIATYDITFSIDNGRQLAAGEALPTRSLRLVMNAVDDPVSAVTIAPLELPAGGQASVIATAVPSYACNPALTYSAGDTDIATVDENGVVTGTTTGATTITVTSVDNPEAQVSGDVTVTAAFSLAIENDAKDDLGVSTGAKQVAACAASGLVVQPSVLNDELTGAYTYQWQLSDEVNFTHVGQVQNGFGNTVIIQSSDQLGTMTSVDVSLLTGDTGATPIADVAGKTVDLTVVNNQMCDPGVSEHAAGFNIDFGIDVAGAAYKGNSTYAASLDTVSGTGNSLQITAGAGVTEDGSMSYSWGAQQVWNKQRNWYSWNYGRGLESIGKTYKYAVWVKLNSVPTEPVTLRQAIVAWNYDGIPDGAAGFPGRYGEAGLFSAELAQTTEWQYVEFVNDKSNNQEWTIPDTWNVVTDVFTLWEVFGLPEGETILLDEYSVIRTDIISE